MKESVWCLLSKDCGSFIPRTIREGKQRFQHLVVSEKDEDVKPISA